MAITNVSSSRPQRVPADVHADRTRDTQQARQTEQVGGTEPAAVQQPRPSDVRVAETAQTREADVEGGAVSRRGMRELEASAQEGRVRRPGRPANTPAPALGDVRGDVAIQRGHSGESVREVQRNLAGAGYTTGTDGRFGPRTERAVQAFQADNELPVTGRVDAGTLDRLRSPGGARQAEQAQDGREALDMESVNSYGGRTGTGPARHVTARGGERIGNLRIDNTRSDTPTVAQIGYPRPMTREQVSQDLFGTRQPPEGVLITPRRHSTDVETARRWDVTLNDVGNRRLTQPAFDAIWQGPSGLENTMSPEVQTALNNRRVPPGAREVRPGIHLLEDRGNTIRIDNRNGGFRHEVWTPLETNEREIARHGSSARPSSDPERYAHLQAHVNRQYNMLMRHRLEEGDSVGQAHAATLAQLDSEARQMIGAWGQAMASGTFGSRAPSTALEQGAAALDAARNPYEAVMSAREQARREGR